MSGIDSVIAALVGGSQGISSLNERRRKAQLEADRASLETSRAQLDRSNMGLSNRLNLQKAGYGVAPEGGGDVDPMSLITEPASGQQFQMLHDPYLEKQKETNLKRKAAFTVLKSRAPDLVPEDDPVTDATGNVSKDYESVLMGQDRLQAPAPMARQMRTETKTVNGRQVLMNMDTGETIKDLGLAPKAAVDPMARLGLTAAQTAFSGANSEFGHVMGQRPKPAVQGQPSSIDPGALQQWRSDSTNAAGTVNAAKTDVNAARSALGLPPLPVNPSPVNGQSNQSLSRIQAVNRSTMDDEGKRQARETLWVQYRKIGMTPDNATKAVLKAIP